jgi:hypothetical protein
VRSRQRLGASRPTKKQGKNIRPSLVASSGPTELIVHSVNREDLYHALSVANYACRGNLAFDEEPEPVTECRRSWRLSLTAKSLEGPGCKRNHPYLPERRLRGACFHASSAYAVAIFERAPTARINVSCLYNYKGVDDFYAQLFAAKSRLSLRRLGEHCNCRQFYDDPAEDVIPDMRISGDWRVRPKPY